MYLGCENTCILVQQILYTVMYLLYSSIFGFHVCTQNCVFCVFVLCGSAVLFRLYLQPSSVDPCSGC